MRIDKSRISGTQFMFTITFFLQSSALLTSFLSGVTDQDSWLSVLFSLVICLPFMFLYSSIMEQFPDKNFIQVLEEVYGKIAGKIIGILYVWFFLTLSALNLSDLGDFAKITVMPHTPNIALTLACTLVAVFGVRFGLKVVTRYAGLFTVIEFIIVAVSAALLYNQIDLENFFPMLSLSPMKYIQSTHIIATIPFGEVVVFLMVTPSIKHQGRSLKKHWVLGVSMGMLTLLVVLLRDVAILGNTLTMFTLPGLVSLRLVSIGEAFSRMEVLFAVGLIMLLFFKISFLCYVSTLAIAQIMGTNELKHLALIVGIFITAYGLTLYPNAVSHNASAHEIVPIVWSLFEFVIPLLTFIVAKIRKLPQKQSGTAMEQEATA